MPLRVKPQQEQGDYLIEVPPLPKMVRDRGVYFRSHPSDPERVVVEVWDGFGTCISVSSVLKATDGPDTRLAAAAWLQSVERSRIQRIG